MGPDIQFHLTVNSRCVPAERRGRGARVAGVSGYPCNGFLIRPVSSAGSDAALEFTLKGSQLQVQDPTGAPDSERTVFVDKTNGRLSCDPRRFLDRTSSQKEV